MTGLSCAKELDTILEDLNLVELYVKAVQNDCDKNLKLLERELMKKKLFLVALELYDIKKDLMASGFPGKNLGKRELENG